MYVSNVRRVSLQWRGPHDVCSGGMIHLIHFVLPVFLTGVVREPLLDCFLRKR